MNHVVITGKITGDIIYEQDRATSMCSFNVKNLYYKGNANVQQAVIVRCIAYGAVADYVGNELYQGCNVIVTGRVCYRRIEIPNSVVNQLYVGCNTVSILEQEEYT